MESYTMDFTLYLKRDILNYLTKSYRNYIISSLYNPERKRNNNRLIFYIFHINPIINRLLKRLTVYPHHTFRQ